MKSKKIISLLLTASLLLAACSTPENNETTSDTASSEVTAGSTEPTVTETSETEPELYEYNPHLYSELIATVVPQDYWDSLYNMCDALKAGEETFECSSQEAYDWCMDESFMSIYAPAAALKISGTSNDGTTPYENGVGRIYYKMPAEEFVQREAEFEIFVTDILNSYLEADDTDFEKCLKLYDYMESNYDYNRDLDSDAPVDDGFVYAAMHNHTGVCIDLAAVYVFLLLQVGIEATEVGCYADGMDHAWAYVIIDGEGYHIDPTWSLKSTRGTDDLYLDYYMMDDDQRTYTGCPVDDLTLQLLPGFWLKRTSLTLPATDNSFYFGDYARLKELDEENKVITYYDVFDEERSYSYR